MFPDARRRQRIMALALPIIGGMVSQNVVNLVDTYMVGSLGDTALAAVGMGSFANWLAMSFITGLSTGVQAMASRRLGEGRTEETAVPLNGGLLLALLLGVPITVAAIATAPLYFPVLVDDPAVYALGIPYLQLRLLGLTAVALNFAFRGYWNGVNLSKLYMGTLVTMHVTNIFLNWVLIYGHLGFPELGVRGAAVATAISSYVGTAVYVVLALRHARTAGFLHGIPAPETMVTMLRLAVPSGVQQLFFAGGMTLFLWIIAKTGTPQLAASTVIVNLMLVAILPGLGFGLAAASLVGQALGRGEPDDAARWGWEVGLLGALVVGAIAFAAVIVPEAFLGLFLRDADTVALAAMSLRAVAIGMAFDTAGTILMNAHFGAGAVGRATTLSVGLQWAGFLPVAFALVTIGGLGMTAVWIGHAVYRTVQMLVFSASWAEGSWKTAKV